MKYRFFVIYLRYYYVLNNIFFQLKVTVIYCVVKSYLR